MFSQTDALNLLESYHPHDLEEQKAKTFICDFIRENTRYWSRETLSGHLTASAWITDSKQTRAVLLHHKKLDLWVQPGGHIDDEDATLLDASLREASEETGLNDLQPKLSSVFDLDVHRIPERKTEPEHWHLDVRYWFTTENMDLTISEESNELSWLSADEIKKLTDEESVLRMVRKTL